MSTRSGYPEEGESIGSYRILRRIGGGGMGVVYEADDQALDRRVALKVIAPHLAEDPRFRARFTREAHALASLDSPHVVHVYTHGEMDGRLYLVTQLVPDGDLAAMLRNFGAPPTRVGLDLIAQVAAGLADAHAQGLVHRDVKPANVLLRRRKETISAFLSDFGIARLIEAEDTRTSATLGTPAYMAPELHTGGAAGVATDIYALGCLLWATLTGRAPYTGTSEYQIVRAHHENPVPQLPGDTPLDAEINRILRTAMAKEPQRRYADAGQLRDVLRRARAMPDTSRPARAPAVADPAPDGPRRGRLIAVSVAVIGGLAILVGVAVGMGDREPGGTFSGDETPGSPSTSSGGTAPNPAVGADDRQDATRSLTDALAEQNTMTSEQARCTAERWIAKAGLEQMAAAGFFDSQWRYVDLDREQMTPEIASAASAAALECATVR